MELIDGMHTLHRRSKPNQKKNSRSIPLENEVLVFFIHSLHESFCSFTFVHTIYRSRYRLFRSSLCTSLLIKLMGEEIIRFH